MTIFLIFKTTYGLGTSNYRCRQALTCALKSSFEITHNLMQFSSLKSSPCFHFHPFLQQQCIMDFRAHLEVKSHGCKIHGLELQHLLFSHWLLKRPYVGARWNSWPKGWAKAIYFSGTKKTRTYYYYTQSPINKILPFLNHVPCGMTIHCLELCENFIRLYNYLLNPLFIRSAGLKIL